MSVRQCNVNISCFKNTHIGLFLPRMLGSPDGVQSFLWMIAHQIIKRFYICILIPENMKSAKYVCYMNLKEYLHCCD